jgi:acylphosphatase
LRRCCGNNNLDASYLSWCFEGENLARHLRIVGIVQGVGFRAAFAKKAESLGLSGWVRNRRDGSVEATVSGPGDALDQISDWAHHGPSGAQVRKVSVAEVADTDLALNLDFKRFEIRATE